MSKYSSLSEFITFNSEFRNAINLYLNLNNREKILSYIPTKSSVNVLKKYMSGIQSNTLHRSMLIGPYGKGKTHLLLVFLAILSMDRKNEAEIAIYKELYARINKVDEEAACLMEEIWNHKDGRFLPVIINCQDDVNQAFLLGLNSALNRYGLSELTPTTHYECAVETIKIWETTYPTTYTEFCKSLKEKRISSNKMRAELLQYNAEYLNIFKEVYPKLTAGSVFNPMVKTDISDLYLSVADKLREECGYRGIYIVFDEFSKFIEGQDKIASGFNMESIQKMCEMAGDAKDPQVHITFVAHKPIKEYGNLLKTETINSFTGIEGRLDDEIYFRTSAKNNYELIQNAIIKSENFIKNLPKEVVERYFSEEYIGVNYGMPGFTTEFTSSDFNKIVARGCYPLTPIAAYLLLNISEKVAQNERTLFTFISNDEQLGMVDFVRRRTETKKWCITPDLIYDYFANLFHKETDEIKTLYQKSVVAIDMASRKFEIDEPHIKIIKALTVLMIVNKKQELPWDMFTLRIAIDMNHETAEKERFETAVSDLCDMGILDTDGDNLFRFKTVEGTELEEEINKRWKLVVNQNAIDTLLQRIYDTKYVFPKRYNYEYGITRYFRVNFIEVSKFLEYTNSDVIFGDGLFCDGKVVVLYQLDDGDYSERIKTQLIQMKSSKLVVMYSKKSIEVKEDIEKLQVLQNIKNDFTFIDKNPKLLPEILVLEETLEEKVKHAIDSVFGRFAEYDIYSLLGELTINESQSVGEVVDTLCYSLYHKTPVINNEFINKQNISTSATKSARKNIMNRLLARNDTSDYLKGTSQDATIYRSMFVSNSLISDEPDASIKEVIDIIENYIDECAGERKYLSDLFDVLCKAPYAMRLGVLPIYLSFVIGRRHVDTVIYYGDKEIALNSDTIINMCDNPDEYSIYISKEDEEREVYLKSLCDIFGVKYGEDEADARIRLILEGMQKWYRALPQVTKNLKQDLEYFEEKYCQKAIKRVGNILQRYEVNPYETIFINLPEVFDATADYALCSERMRYFKEKMSGYFYWIANKATVKTKEIFKIEKDSLYHGLIEWYDAQSVTAKGEISEQKIAIFMGTLTTLIKISTTNSYDDLDITQKIVKAVSGVYIDYWSGNSLEQYVTELFDLKSRIESMVTENKGNEKQVYMSRSGKQIYYDSTVGEDTELFKDILAGTISDFEGLGKNDLIAILLDEVERIIAKED